ncbi:nuclear transport factor 2 family protein [Streptomyces sp. NPDC001068]|uniref:nuclear transport factor 2 family protein n=1 Tax=Streptomyces sp. NPDC001068 TaxID=3364544 RepID=UPI00369E54DE
MATEHENALTTAKQYFERWEAHDAAGMRELLTDETTIVFPMSIEGTPEPWAVFDGIEKAMGYLRLAMSNLPQLRLIDREWSVSHDARYVHLHARGDMITRTNLLYHNVYVFRLEIADGRIIRVDEIANPVPWAATGLAG